MFGYSVQWSSTYSTLQFGIGFRRYPWVPVALDIGHWCFWIEKDDWEAR